MFKKKRQQNQARNYQSREHTKQRLFSYSSSRTSSQRAYSSDAADKGPSPVSLIVKIQYSLAALLITGGLFYLSMLSSDAIVKVDINQSLADGSSDYEAAVERELKASILNKNKLTLNRQTLENNLKSQFPEVKSVRVKSGLLSHRPEVRIQLVQPAARLVTPSSTYILDNEGNALFDTSKQPADFDINSLVPISDNSDHQIEIGKPAVTEGQILYVREVIGQFNRKNIKIKNMSLESGGLDLHVSLVGQKYFIKFSFLNSARLSAGAYFALLDKNININQYIDVRVADRAFVR